ncbi:MAG: J domain-containing protein [Gammaproteobacteria bacterium]|jgi:DnaJ-class molecular chaperone|nr:J domain-containing protein [Gammaproteobacteria bacterium]
MQDPYLTLGVARDDATDEVIRQAYLTAIRRHPAEREPERFQAVCDAYETLKTKKSRLAYVLFNTDMPTPAEILEQLTESGQRSRPDIELFCEILGGAADKR